MNSRCGVFVLLLVIGSVMGCFPLHDTPPTLPTTDGAAAQTTPKTHSVAKPKKNTSPTTNPLTESLGGVLSSDSWIVNQEKEQEEFLGNVSYDNGIYRFKADYALSERKLNRITTKGNVFLRKREADGTWYQVQADTVVYDYQSGQGYAQAENGKRINLQYKTAQEDLIVARSRRADFNTKKQTCQLTGQIWVTRTDKNGQVTTLKADRMTAKQEGLYGLLQGNAEAANEQYQLKAQNIEYDGKNNMAYAYGKRPLAQGTTDEGTFAIIADKVTTHTDTHHIQLEGQVQGWIVSDQINQAENKKK